MARVMRGTSLTLNYTKSIYSKVQYQFYERKSELGRLDQMAFASQTSCPSHNFTRSISLRTSRQVVKTKRFVIPSPPTKIGLLCSPKQSLEKPTQSALPQSNANSKKDPCGRTSLRNDSLIHSHRGVLENDGTAQIDVGSAGGRLVTLRWSSRSSMTPIKTSCLASQIYMEHQDIDPTKSLLSSWVLKVNGSW